MNRNHVISSASPLRLLLILLAGAALPLGLLTGASRALRIDSIYDARENGLKCDGFTDDTVAFNSLISKISSAGAGKIVLPTGICIVTSVNLANNISIVGHGAGSTIIKVKSNSGDYASIFGGNKSIFVNIVFSDLTVDQNSKGNPVTSEVNHGKPRFVIATGAGSSKLSVERVEFKDLGNINTIYSGSDFTDVTDSSFALNCHGSVYHDHSTIYVAGAHSQTQRNLFKGCVNAAGSVTAIETHGGNQIVARNQIDDFWNGMNITGVAPADSMNVSVADNTIQGAYYGIQLWSNRYRSHTTGYGLGDVTIKSNAIRLTQTAWTRNPITEGVNIGNPSGIWVNAASNLPLIKISIQSNSIEYDLETASLAPYDPSGIGIGYWDSTNLNSITSFKIVGNTIKNANINAIRVSANGSDFDISGNIVSNPGSSANPGLNASYRNGIFVASTTALASVRVNNNTITDAQPTSRMARGIYFAVAPGSHLSVIGDHFALIGPNTNSLRAFVDSDSDTQLPYVQGFVDSPRITPTLLPARKVTPGSTFTDVSHGYLYHVKQDNRTWTGEPIHSISDVRTR
jgi:hypothetical protein